MAVLVVLAGLAGLAGCALVRPAPPLPPPEELLAGLRERQAAVRTLILAGRGSLKAKGRTLRGDFMIAAAKPDCLRLEAYGPFGLPALFVVVQGEWVKAVSFLERRYFEGRASAPRMASFLPLDLSAGELIALLSAAPIPEGPGQVQSMAPGQAPALQMAAKTSGSAVVVVEGADGPVRLLFGDDARLLAASLGEEGGELLALYSDWRPNGAASAFPFGLDFSLPARARQLHLDVSEARLNEPLAASVFELEPPEGFKVIEVD